MHSLRSFSRNDRRVLVDKRGAHHSENEQDVWQRRDETMLLKLNSHSKKVGLVIGLYSFFPV
ncbi:hypothetical protein [Rhodohalobacter sp. SW132]|uniref:hypothetical protein n=1 Tax=Rhodohalobacter sp. SW132 TaxID=2293433 RepID=UPI0011C07917|nr:hypothetical protein [Rhodohalobacter sp. SW132]